MHISKKQERQGKFEMGERIAKEKRKKEDRKIAKIM